MKNPKSILITGASSGLGAALAREYASDGITLFLCGRNGERLKTVKDECRSRGATVHGEPVDVRNEQAMSDWIKKCDRVATLDLVVANAGIGIGFTTKMDLGEHVKQIYDINVGGVFNSVHPAIRLMQSRKKGQIAIISSLAGYHGLPGSPAYSTSKACVKAYGEALRGLYARHGVDINVVCPGYVKSPMTADNKFFMPFLMETDKAVRLLRRGLARNQARITFPWQLSLIYGTLVRFLPEWLFERIFRLMPAKN